MASRSNSTPDLQPADPGEFIYIPADQPATLVISDATTLHCCLTTGGERHTFEALLADMEPESVRLSFHPDDVLSERYHGNGGAGKARAAALLRSVEQLERQYDVNFQWPSAASTF